MGANHCPMRIEVPVLPGTCVYFIFLLSAARVCKCFELCRAKGMHDMPFVMTARDAARIQRQLASQLVIQGRIQMEPGAVLGYTVGHSQRPDSRPRMSPMDGVFQV
jgi:hypothetical protein